MNIALWIVQALLALAFAGAGATKLLTPIDELATRGMGQWAADSPALLIHFIGVSELLGAMGLVLPTATKIAPRLTSVAALGLVLIMVLAAATHLTYGESEKLAPNAVLGVLAAFVAWGRRERGPAAKQRG